MHEPTHAFANYRATFPQDMGRVGDYCGVGLLCRAWTTTTTRAKLKEGV